MLPLDPAAGGIIDDRRGAAGQRVAARIAIMSGIPPGSGAAKRAGIEMPRLDFVIASQCYAAIFEREAARAVGPIGHDQSVVHPVAKCRGCAIAKPTRQIEQPGWIRLERAIAAHWRSGIADPHGGACAERPGEGSGGEAEGEASTVEHGCLSGAWSLSLACASR